MSGGCPQSNHLLFSSSISSHSPFQNLTLLSLSLSLFPSQPITTKAIIDALWETGVVWAQSHALEIFSAATKRGHFKRDPFTHQIAVLNLHAMTAGVAMLALYSWLEDIHRLATGSSPKDDSSQNEQPGSTSLLPDQLLIVLDAGRTSREQGNSVIKEAVSTACTFWESPFKPCTPSSLQLHHTGGGRPTAPPFLSALVCSGADAERWIRNGSFRALMASLFPFSAAIIGGQAKQTDAAAADPLPAANQPDQPSASLGHRHSLPGSGRALVDSVAASELEEAKVSADCQAQFALVRSFEASHGLDLPSMPDAFVEQRSLLVSRILEVSISS